MPVFKNKTRPIYMVTKTGLFYSDENGYYRNQSDFRAKLATAGRSHEAPYM